MNREEQPTVFVVSVREAWFLMTASSVLSALTGAVAVIIGMSAIPTHQDRLTESTKTVCEPLKVAKP